MQSFDIILHPRHDADLDTILATAGRIAEGMPAVEAAHDWLTDVNLTADYDQRTLTISACFTDHDGPINAPLIALVTGADLDMVFEYFQLRVEPWATMADQTRARIDWEASQRRASFVTAFGGD